MRLWRRMAAAQAADYALDRLVIHPEEPSLSGYAMIRFVQLPTIYTYSTPAAHHRITPIYVNRSQLKATLTIMDINTIKSALLQRNPAMTREQFSVHWFTKHAPLVVPLLLHSQVQHYEQARDPPFSRPFLLCPP
jgi:hypothetical protein